MRRKTRRSGKLTWTTFGTGEMLKIAGRTKKQKGWWVRDDRELTNICGQSALFAAASAP